MNSSVKMGRLAIFVAVLLLLGACGFQLQTKVELPAEMQRTKLEVQSPYSEFARRLETHLEQNGIQVVTGLGEAAVLEVPVNNMRKEIQSISDNARVQEYLIRHTVQFRLIDSEGLELIPMQTFEQSRIYSFNEQDILAAEREDEFLRKDLSDATARMVVRRIGTYGK
jgi:LPS-assembly lipoprotein